MIGLVLQVIDGLLPREDKVDDATLERILIEYESDEILPPRGYTPVRGRSARTVYTRPYGG